MERFKKRGDDDIDRNEQNLGGGRQRKLKKGIVQKQFLINKNPRPSFPDCLKVQGSLQCAIQATWICTTDEQVASAISVIKNYEVFEDMKNEEREAIEIGEQDERRHDQERGGQVGHVSGKIEKEIAQ